MKSFFFILSLGFFSITLNAQIGFEVNSPVSETARFNGTDRMYIALYEDEEYRGYLGSFSGASPWDVDLGTGSSNVTGKLHFTIRAFPKMTINSEGKVGIGTESPTELLEVSGRTKTNSLSISNLSTPGTPDIRPVYSDENGNISNYKVKYEVVQSLDFQNNFSNFHSSTLGAHRTTTSSVQPIDAAIHLPHGVTVSHISVVFRDDSSDDLSIRILSYSLNNPSFLTHATLNTSGASSDWRSVSQNVAFSIDNSNRYYFIQAGPNTGSEWDNQNTMIHSVRFTYIE